jgi:hypothetical protein
MSFNLKNPIFKLTIARDSNNYQRFSLLCKTHLTAQFLQ